MEVRVVAAVVARGGTVRARDGDLVCRMPRGVSLPPNLAEAVRANKGAVLGALAMGNWEETVQHIVEMGDGERSAYRAALAHDLSALAEAESRLAERGGDER